MRDPGGTRSPGRRDRGIGDETRRRQLWRESKRRQRKDPQVRAKERTYDETPAGRERKRRYDRGERGRLMRYRWRRANSKADVPQFGSVALALEMAEIEPRLRRDHADAEKFHVARARANEVGLRKPTW
jgi:hypothetical protein